ncbi:hypothetical protein [Argonema galeatum]|uniref:hypothetical protein n=1 Tax=Argonema galeatum TaxID=2942762 RepID=UPI0020118E1D|nr:hypothetical protein [Argonema galeatum]MCL1463408.1 hypothetical protein [Argonema galeatum A003/A1]
MVKIDHAIALFEQMRSHSILLKLSIYTNPGRRQSREIACFVALDYRVGSAFVPKLISTNDSSNSVTALRQSDAGENTGWALPNYQSLGRRRFRYYLRSGG